MFIIFFPIDSSYDENELKTCGTGATLTTDEQAKRLWYIFTTLTAPAAGASSAGGRLAEEDLRHFTESANKLRAMIETFVETSTGPAYDAGEDLSGHFKQFKKEIRAIMTGTDPGVELFQFDDFLVLVDDSLRVSNFSDAGEFGRALFRFRTCVVHAADADEFEEIAQCLTSMYRRAEVNNCLNLWRAAIVVEMYAVGVLLHDSYRGRNPGGFADVLIDAFNDFAALLVKRSNDDDGPLVTMTTTHRSGLIGSLWSYFVASKRTSQRQHERRKKFLREAMRIMRKDPSNEMYACLIGELIRVESRDE